MQIFAEVRAPVDLRPLTQAEVGSKTLGYLDAVLVDRGDRVKKGQVLALVRPSDLHDQLAAARGSAMPSCWMNRGRNGRAMPNASMASVCVAQSV